MNWYIVRNYAGRIMGVWSDEDENIPWYSEQIDKEELIKELECTHNQTPSSEV